MLLATKGIMRTLFLSAETSQYVSDSAVAHDENKVGTQQNLPVEVTNEQVSGNGKKKSRRQKKVNKVLSPQEQRLRNRKRAAVTLAVSLLIGGRWFVANQNPVYPKGEGVYAKSVAPKWGELKQPNAATFYMAATDALDVKTIFSRKNAPARTTAFIMDEPASVQKPYVEQAQPAFALLRQGMQYPYLPDYQTNYFKSDANAGRGISRPVPNYINQREMARLLAAEANVRASEGNHSGAMESSLDVIRYGVDNSHGHTLIDGMIGCLIQRIGAKEGVKHIAKLTAPEARAASTRLETILTTAPTLAEVMTQERDWCYETIQTVFQNGNAANLVEAADIGVSLKGVWAKLAYGGFLMYYTKQGMVNDYAHYMDQVLVRLKMPYQQAKLLPSIKPSSNPIVRIAIPNYERAFLQSTGNVAWEHILLTKTAVQAYRGEHNNAFPASLDELTQGAKPYLRAVPADPFSTSGREPLRYDPRTGDVYSVGENGTDEGSAGDDNGELYKK